MAYVVASDRTGGAPQCLDTVCKILEEKGNTVKKLNVDPNSEGTIAKNCEKDDIAVMIVNGICLGTFISFYDDLIKPKKCKEVMFAMPANLMKGSKFNKKELLSSKKLVITNDGTHWTQQAYDWSGKYTPVEVFDKLDGITGVWAENCEELAQAIMDGGGLSGGGGSTDTSSGGGAAIKDKTFEDCIRRICAATDSVFLVENNAAIMFPYTDWMAFTLRQKVKEIKANMIDRELFEMEYNTDGYYNKVTTVYGAEEDTTTDKSKKTKDKKNNDDTTDTKKNGNVTQERKSMPTGGTLLSQQYDPLVAKYGVLEKKVTTNFPNEETAQYVSNALLIQYVREFNNSCRFRMLNNQKLIGGTFYSVQNPFDKKNIELYYLNGYTVFQKDKQPITTDVEFKYGPEGVENIMDYQRYSGTSGGSASTGSTASSSEEAIWQDAAKVHYLRRDSRTCSNQDPKGAYDTIHPKLGQDDCFADCYGMSAYLYYRFNNEASIPCRVVGNSTHHVVMIFKNNAWYEPRSEYKKLEGDFAWKTNQCTDVLLAEPNNPNSNTSGNTGSNDSTSGGNSNNNSNNSGSGSNS